VSRAETTPQVSPPKGRVDVEAIAPLARRLESAARGVIVCGPRAADEPGFAAAVCSLAQRLGWPILADAASGVRFAGAPEIVASYDAMLRHEPFARAHAPELVLRFGQLPASKPLGRWLEEHAAGRTIVVDAHGAMNDPSHGLDTWVIAEPSALVEALGRSVRKGPSGDWLTRWQRAEGAAQRALATECGDGFWEGAVARTVVEALPEGALLHVASSMPIRDLESFAPATSKALTVTCNRGANGIDGTIATLTGQALAWTKGPAVALLGDLAFLHDHASLVAARELGVGLTLVVIDNGGGGIFDFLPISAHPTAYDRYFRTPHHADLGALARAAGFTHERVDDLGALRTALGRDDRRALRVIEARVGSNDNVARHKNAWARVARALTEVA
jgi:2-succinyl-5-enolpyruvyl-6-hydroxy-3-cyclohexene-1-carboxylate synthase